MYPGGRGYSEPRSRHCTASWETEQKFHLKIEGGEKKHRSNGNLVASFVMEMADYFLFSDRMNWICLQY